MPPAPTTSSTTAAVSNRPRRAAPDVPGAHSGHGPGRGRALDLVIPVHNEQAALPRAIATVTEHLARTFPYPWRITIADNASSDDTARVADELAAQTRGVRVLHLAEKGRGRALQAAWSTADATVLAYVDVDLSTDLSALLPLVAPLLSGHSEVAIGTRLARESRVTRGAKREIISRCYNILVRTVLRSHVSDAQCGFKAVRADAAEHLLPQVRDTSWFFDTELLVLAERAGMRIHEVPVDWVDDPDSRVDLVPTALADMRGIARVLGAILTGRLPRHRADAPRTATQAAGVSSADRANRAVL